ncbi:MAG: hypothetical protein ABSF09_12500 [Candidatus Bathyarchaeia archaeon]|jgi:hypothetical protein
MATGKSWEPQLQELIDIIAKPNWMEAEKYNQTAATLCNVCVGIVVRASRFEPLSSHFLGVFRLTYYHQKKCGSCNNRLASVPYTLICP